MRLRFINLIFFLLISSSGVGQVWPQHGVKLNFTQVMFEYENVKGAKSYIIQIIEDSAGSTFKYPMVEQRDLSTATLVNDLKFGKKYVWRYAGVVEGISPTWHGPYNFETIAKDSADPDFKPVTVVLNDTVKNAKGVIVADYGYVTNRSGDPIWYLPNVDNKFKAARDIRVTPYGTITFISSHARIYEIDLKGNILWQAPDNDKSLEDTVEFYHHDFQRLPNGHYMALRNKAVWKKVPSAYQQQAKTALDAPRLELADKARRPELSVRMQGDELYAKIKFGIIVEYDHKGNIVWSWDSEQYFSDADVFPLFLNVLAQANNPIANLANDPDAHLNAFSVDEKDEFVYAGFRQISRIIKIEKKTGKVVCSWGDKTPMAGARLGDALFCHQHGVNILRDGSIALFDNSDTRLQDKPARALIFSQPVNNDTSKILWQFDCIFDSAIAKSTRGGNVDELPNGNMLVCMGMGPLGISSAHLMPPLQGQSMATMPMMMTPAAQVPAAGPRGPLPLMSRIFEVTRNKQIVWSAVIAKAPQTPPYRAHYASSLYPCYFTAACNKDAFYKSDGFFGITIYNKGSESDSYIISTRFVKAGITSTTRCNNVSAGNSAEVKITPDKLPMADDEIEVDIKSKTNPGFERKVKMFFRK